MKRVSTCIPGLDRLLEGGFPETGSVMLCGGEGTGKTLFGLQFLYEGSAKMGEPGVLIQAEGFNQELYWYEKMLGWNLKGMQDRNRLVIYSFKPKDYGKFAPEQLEGEVLSKLRNILVPMGIRRAVIDTISPFKEGMQAGDYRKSLYELVSFFKESNITSVIIGGGERHGEHHICDGVIELRHGERENGQYAKELMVSKMAAKNFPRAWYPVTISDRLGFSVRPFI